MNNPKTLKEEVKLIKKEKPPRKTKEQKKADKEYKSKHAQRRGFFPSLNRYKVALILMLLIAIALLAALIVVDILPSDLTFILIAVMLGMIPLASFLFASKHKVTRIIGIVVAIVFAVSASFITGMLTETHAMLNKVSDVGLDSTGPAPISVDVTEEPFNVYITGIDQWANEKGLDLERSDVNMLVTVNPKTKKILLTSIPRDTYVKLHTSQQMDKLTHTGIYGVDETLNSVQDWLGVDINYYVKMNFTGARDIINAMGGIEVYSPVEFTSTLKGYEYHKGWNKLNGKEALYFARERKSFEGQDAVRVENQQRVMKAIIKKMTSSTTLLTRYGEVMDAAGEQMSTNLSSKELTSFARMQVTDLASWDVKAQKIEGEVDQDYVASLTQSMKFDIYRPSEESVKQCVEGINAVMNPTEQEIEKANEGRTRSFVINAVERLLNKNDKDDVEINNW